jgi:hypothetical protein
VDDDAVWSEAMRASGVVDLPIFTALGRRSRRCINGAGKTGHRGKVSAEGKSEIRGGVSTGVLPRSFMLH